MIVLTPQERTLLLHLAQGKVLERVREEMGLCNKTFNTVRLGLFEKLGITDRAAAVSRAFIYGLFGTMERLMIVSSPLDKSILQLVAQNWRDADIQRHLHCSSRDIVECMRRAIDICNVPTRAELVQYLKKEGSLAA